MVDPLRWLGIIFLRLEKGGRRFQDGKSTEKNISKNPLAIGCSLLQTSNYVE
uniref:Uncharacterized protein n=1 Tax=Pseudomonas aeruginosa TaxID=287 RepID=A0A6C0L385_PSEAI|nr:hypothetical protein [Pseudomonas aeruginosa]